MNFHILQISVQTSLASYFRFDLQCDEFGVEIQVLKDSVVLREWLGWTEECEKELKKKNSPVVEAHFLTNYKNFLFCLRLIIKCKPFTKEIWSFGLKRLEVVI